MKEPILCVDDELAILGGFQRQFRGEFNIVGAMNGVQALEALSVKGPFAVVLSDYNMPGMNGLALLRKVRELSPDSIRIMLTGKADAEAGLAAINDETLFRFLTKPCSPELLASALRAALKQYRLVMSERLFERRAIDSARLILEEMQKLGRPDVFARQSRMEAIMRLMVAELEIENLSSFVLAAALSHVGCMGVSHEIVRRVLSAKTVPSAAELVEFERHAELGALILDRVPALGNVVDMVRNQFTINANLTQDRSLREVDPSLIGSQLLRLANALDDLSLRGVNYLDAIARMSFGSHAHDPAFIAALKAITRTEVLVQRRTQFLNTMRVGMLTQDDFITRAGYLLVPKGALISHRLLLTLKHYASEGQIDLAALR